ncbi:MAG: hypothetical protein AAFW69_08865 [Pseudomonadota bacterium]
MRHLLLLFALLAVQPALAQTGQLLTERVGAGAEEEAPHTIPDDLSPEMVDGMLSRMTDGEIREILRDELVRRAEQNEAAEGDAMPPFAAVEARLADMAGTIATRAARWAEAFANIGDRLPIVAERAAGARNGVGGMILAALALVAAGVGAALLLGRVTRPWRDWLKRPERGHYWDRVVRTLALGVVEVLPILVFVAVTRALGPLLAADLGPLRNMVWIYHAGVSYAWAFILIERRAFAPDAPEIRIAPLSDAAATAVHRLLRGAVQIGAAGWLLAGFSPTLGFGFPPAMVIVALSGTLVAALLFLAIARNVGAIRAAVGAVTLEGVAQPGALARLSVLAAPAVLALYVLGAGGYWIAHWLERGQHNLAGPVGTLVVGLVIPILDRRRRRFRSV